MYVNLIKRSVILIKTAIVRRGFFRGGTLSVNNREELSERCNLEKKEKGQKSKRRYEINLVIDLVLAV